jgi:AcrR family transcriptional regulator
MLGPDPPMDTEQILDTALSLAQRRGWDALHLHEVAEALGIGLAELHRHVRLKDDLAESLFDRAERALVHAGDAPEAATLSERERLQRTLHAWFDTLDPHRAAAAAMQRYRLQPEHLHLQAAGLLRISRTVQCWREAARLGTAGWRREAEEAVLSAIFVGAMSRWLFDGTPGAARTRAWIAARLEAAERAARLLPR